MVMCKITHTPFPHAEYADKYAEYVKQHAEYAKLYARKYDNMAIWPCAESHIPLSHMQNMLINMQNM